MKNSAQRLRPSIDKVDQSPDVVILSLTIDPDLRCFQGHFDDAAVVPGIAQLDWAVSFAKEYLALQGEVLEVNVLKFQKLLRPNMNARLEITKKSTTKFTFSFSYADDKFSSARVELR